jgi:hypothetical protein
VGLVGGENQHEMALSESWEWGDESSQPREAKEHEIILIAVHLNTSKLETAFLGNVPRGQPLASKS